MELETPAAIRHTVAAMNEHAARPHAAVVGLGRFGRFWAHHISREFEVSGTSRRTIVGLPDGVRQRPLRDAVADARYVFLTVAISAIPDVLDEIAPMLPAGCTVVDTCSVKVFPAREMEDRLPDHTDIVAAHPMFGPDSARERTDQLPMIAWPIRDSQGRYSELCRRMERLGIRIVEMDPESHDREAAFSQGVTHLVGRILKEMDLSTSDIATLGYTRLLQVMEQTCNDPVALFQDLQRFNPYTRDMRRRFAAALERTEHLLAESEES